MLSVADPGFPVGGAPTHWGGANLRRVHFSVKTYVKTKEIDPVGGGARRGAPLDPPMVVSIDPHLDCLLRTLNTIRSLSV